MLLLHTRDKSKEPWQASVPEELLPAVTHLRNSYDDAHWAFGQTTCLFCYALLHKEKAGDPNNEYLQHFKHMKDRAGAHVATEFNQCLEIGTEASLFKAFYDLYVENVLVQAMQIAKI